MLNRDVLKQQMPKTPFRFNTPLRILGISLFIALLGIIVGAWIGSTIFVTEAGKASPEVQKEIDGLRNTISTMESINITLTEILNEKENIAIVENERKTQTGDADDPNVKIEPDSSQYQNQIDALKLEVQSLKVEYSGLTDKQNTLLIMADAIEKHRLLLLEMRKSLPLTREGSAGYWYNMKNVAVKADPSLSASVNRVILKIDNYFDWNDNSPQNDSSTQEFMKWQADYANSGALEYEEAAIAFTKDALRSVIIKLESVVITVQ